MADDLPSTRVQALDDPQLRSLVPLLYVAWLDSDLSTEERAALGARIEAQPWLRPRARTAALAWLEPHHPPTPAELSAVRDLLGRVAQTASPRARRSFAALARELADSPETEQAAEELGRLVGAEHALPQGQGASRPELPVSVQEPGISQELERFLDGRHAAVRLRVRDFLASPERRAYGLGSEEMRDHVWQQLRELASTGMIELAFPGVTTDGDLGPFMAAFEELGHGDLSLAVKLGVQAGLYGGALWALGTDRHHARLPRVARLEELGCFAMSEVGHGSNVAELETTAHYDAQARELVLHTPAESARKEWIGGAARDARWAVVFAQLHVSGECHGVHAVLVPIRAPDGSALAGVRTGDSGHKMGLLGVDNGRLWFEHLRVPVEHLLDRFAGIDADGKYHSPISSPSRRFFTMLGTLVGGRICVGSSAVSAARTSLAIAVRYAAARRQFGPGEEEPERALLEYPTHQRRLLPYLAESVVLRTAFEAVRARHADLVGAPQKEGDAAELDTRQLEAEVAILKVLGSRHGVDATQACREACGGQGYLAVNRIADLRDDVEIFTTFEGDNFVLAQLVAKALLSNYRHQFAGGGPFVLARVLAERVLSRVRQKNPVEVRRTDSSHLRSREFQSAAFAHREAHLVETLAARLRKRLGEGEPVDSAFLALQEHAVAAAWAFGERLCFDGFCAAEGASELSEEARGLLGSLGDLYALSRFEHHAGWFVTDGYFEPGKARAIRKQVEALLREIAPRARSIVDAFGIHDACLAAPIAFFDPAHPQYA